jgi:hypothetical protein
MRTLIAVAALLSAGSAMAAEDLCTLQLQKLSDQAAMTKPATATGHSAEVNKLIAQAKSYQAKGDNDNCERTGQQALTMIKQTPGGSATP